MRLQRRKKILPRVKIVGITENSNPKEVQQTILEQNREYFDVGSHLSVVHVGKSRRKNNFYAYAEVDGKVYGKLMESRRVNVGWDRCMVYDANEIMRCYNCMGFNHKAKDCKNRLVCSRCGSGHKEKDCNVEENKATCVNCKHAADTLKLKIDFNHHTLSRECPTYMKKLERKKYLIDFL